MARYQLVFLEDIPSDGRSCDTKELVVVELKAKTEKAAKEEAATWLKLPQNQYRMGEVRLVKTVSVLSFN